LRLGVPLALDAYYISINFLKKHNVHTK
jgi:hypothetical protein